MSNEAVMSNNTPGFWQSARTQEALWGCLLIACVIKYANVWLWSGGVITDVGIVYKETDRALYVFQSLLWVSIAASVAWHVWTQGFDVLAQVFLPFVPFIAIALLCSATGQDPFMSFRHVSLWLVAVLAGTMVGRHLSRESVIDGFLWTSLVILLLSLFMVLTGVEVESVNIDEQGWHGLFVHKNGFGWAASLMFAISMAVLTRDRWWLAGTVMVLAFICVLGARSGTSMVATACVGVHIVLYRLFYHRLSAPLALAAQLAYLAFLVLAGQLLMPIALDILGKDPTFTGRTEIWGIYIEHALESPWLGQGPGSFSGVSAVTERLLQSLGHLGEIYTPHNMYIAVLGDTGVFGLTTLVGTLGYALFYAARAYPSTLAAATSAIGVLFVVSGAAETREVFTPGYHWFLIFLFRASALRGQARVHAS